MGKIYKTLIMDGQISLSVLDTTDIVDAAIKYHGLSPVCAAALGRTLTATAFMASGLKDEKAKLSVTIKGGGLGGQIVTAADGRLRIRGSIEVADVDIPLKSNGKLDVSAVTGRNGYLTVVKDLGLKEPYVGRSNLVSGEIAEDFTAYYAYSEQQPTAMALGVLIGKDGSCIGAGGVVVQPLPDCTEENIVKAETLMTNFKDISAQISESGGKGVCDKYFPTAEFTVFNPVYKCNCSREYIDKILLTIGKDELLEEVRRDGKIEVSCQFCNSRYQYNEDDVLGLFKDTNEK